MFAMYVGTFVLTLAPAFLMAAHEKFQHSSTFLASIFYSLFYTNFLQDVFLSAIWYSVVGLLTFATFSGVFLSVFFFGQFFFLIVGVTSKSKMLFGIYFVLSFLNGGLIPLFSLVVR